jgi:hypothetical protein
VERGGSAELPPGVDREIDDFANPGGREGGKRDLHSYRWLRLPRRNQCAESAGVLQHRGSAAGSLLVRRLSQRAPCPVAHRYQPAWGIQHRHRVSDYNDLLLWFCQPYVAKVLSLPFFNTGIWGNGVFNVLVSA